MVKLLNRYIEQVLDKVLKLDFNFDIRPDDVWQDLHYLKSDTPEDKEPKGIHVVLLENIDRWLCG
jgi:hypothetical protein